VAVVAVMLRHQTLTVAVVAVLADLELQLLLVSAHHLL
jgi:hypothetical protein